jgi:hypothetical protein
MQPLLVFLTLAAAKLREGEVTELLPGEDRLTFKLRTKIWATDEGPGEHTHSDKQYRLVKRETGKPGN